jgi:hypothetical protein
MTRKCVLLLLTLLASTAFAADNLDSLLSAQRVRAGSNVLEIFSVLDKTDSGLTADEKADLRFLIAYLPLSDLASMNSAMLLSNVRLARRTRSEFSWGKQLPDELYRHFVLPHRVSQEPFVEGWREQFLNVLAPRVKNLSMTDAALEVNHWCHEVATYKPSDGRDQDPLTTIRAGLGRCEEEMILAIDALRAVGIPARQCYTPFWAHQDDNHAWTEVWTDGKWHYFGACEPEPILDRGWFTNAAQRAMLVVSTAYGDYTGNEPVLRRYGSTTLINSTSVYGKTHTLHVTLLDDKGKPVPNAKVIFNLFNYSCIMPALALTSDANGKVELVCGQGDWYITAGTDSLAALQSAKAADTTITLRLAPTADITAFTQADYTPPPEAPEIKGAEQDSMFRCRNSREDSLREDLWMSWALEGKISMAGMARKPDSSAVITFASASKLDGKELLEILLGARGNWGNLFYFLTGNYPKTVLSSALSTEEMKARMILLNNLSDKDRRDFSVDILNDHYLNTTGRKPLLELAKDLSKLDSTSRKRIEDYVITPRISGEPSAAWRRRLNEFLVVSSRAFLASSSGDTVLINLLKSLPIDSSKDRLGPPLTPVQTLNLMRGTQADIERLYIAFCRVRGIPARFNPVAGQLERWDSTAWVAVDLKPQIKSETKKPPQGQGQLTVEAAADSATQAALYLKDWGVQTWETDHLTDVDFGYHVPFKEVTWPQDLPAGRYALVSGIRRKDGSAPVALKWFDIKPGERTAVKLSFRP